MKVQYLYLQNCKENENKDMIDSKSPSIIISRDRFLQDPQGRTFSDIMEEPEQPFEIVLKVFNNEDRQRRMEESEIHHDRSPLAGVVRELESDSIIDKFLEVHIQKSKRLRQAIGVLVRMIMEARGWRKTGRKGSLGVRVGSDPSQPSHNTGGLAFWFMRAERYVFTEGMPYKSVRERCKSLGYPSPRKPRSKTKR